LELAKPRPDRGIDWIVLAGEQLERQPQLDVQLKCTAALAALDADARYELRAKNYEDLILSGPAVPRVLVVVQVPAQIADWTLLSHEQMTLRHSARWVSLMGQPSVANTSTVTVDLPASQQLTPVTLWDLMVRIDAGMDL
jgi:hypothetical protein